MECVCSQGKREHTDFTVSIQMVQETPLLKQLFKKHNALEALTTRVNCITQGSLGYVMALSMCRNPVPRAPCSALGWHWNLDAKTEVLQHPKPLVSGTPPHQSGCLAEWSFSKITFQVTASTLIIALLLSARSSPDSVSRAPGGWIVTCAFYSGQHCCISSSLSLETLSLQHQGGTPGARCHTVSLWCIHCSHLIFTFYIHNQGLLSPVSCLTCMNKVSVNFPFLPQDTGHGTPVLAQPRHSQHLGQQLSHAEILLEH